LATHYDLEWKKILDSVADGVFTVDARMFITSFNRAAERITGVPRERAIGRPCHDVFHGDRCQSNCGLKRSFATGRESVNLKVHVVNDQGQTIPISVSTAVLRDEDGRIVGGVETFRDLSAEEALRKELRRNYTFEDIVSKNHKMREIFAILPDVAKSGCNVLVEGESGTGKELVARALHHLSEQRRGPYVAVNCAALPDALLESELFGYVRGAFTDAKRNKPGRFALAAGGTIFLDEIGSVSGALQVKLLRVLQERVFEPLGGVAPTRMEARVIAATNRDLAALVQAGEFRQDLYYRLNVVRLQLPSLRERREDVPLLAEHFLRHFNLKQGKEVLGLLPETLAVLLDYSWPGNVRELENAIEHAFVMCRGSYLGPEHLPRELTARLTPVQAPATLQDAEQEMLQQVLAKHHGKYVEAARELGIHRTTLYRKRRKYQLQ